MGESLGAEPARGLFAMSDAMSGRKAREETAIYRILDANLNRALEGLRVVEEYCRFAREEAHLAGACKQLRHELVACVAPLSRGRLHGSRDTLRDVGASLGTAAEYLRADLESVVAANWSRIEQALRALEEYGKVVAPQLAVTLEGLRYRAYVLERATTLTEIGRERLDLAQLYVLLDGRASVDEFSRLVTCLIEGQVDVIQLRDKRLADGALLERARLLRRLTRSHGPLFIMNDRPDLALLAEADGVHVGQGELSVKDVRDILGGDALIGVSTHDLDQARRAVLDGASYLGCGPTFPSATKSFSHFPGLEFLRAVGREIGLPAFAIGGIDQANVDQVCATGVLRVAVSHSVVETADPAGAARHLKASLLRARQGNAERTGLPETATDRSADPDT
jgi:thiamine-phosphate pyrophosphorylase